MMIGCRSCGGKGRDLLGYPCGCGSSPIPPFTHAEAQAIFLKGVASGFKQAAAALTEAAQKEFTDGNDQFAVGIRKAARAVHSMWQKQDKANKSE